MTTSTPNQFRLYTGNNLEVLAEAFAKARLEHKEYFHQDDFFAEEKVCVATQGMRVWLEHYLVQQGHVVAGIQFPFLRDAIDHILEIFMKDEKAYRPDLFQEDVLTWRIYRLLTEENLTGSLELLNHYLKKENDDTKDIRRYQLARKLSQVYYDYIAFIPEKLHPEESGTQSAISDADQWQLALWQKLCKDDQGNDVISPAKALLRFLAKGTTLTQDGYTPITFFGVSAMPPYFLLVLKKLSTVQPVNFFYLNHCDDLWDDVKTNWEKGKISEAENKLDTLFAGNSLLGNFGIQGREFFKVVLDEEDDMDLAELTSLVYDKSWNNPKPSDQTTSPDTKKEPCLLLDIQERVKRNDATTKTAEALPLGDDSLTIHSCFNEIREVEALQDCLLKLIKKYHDEKRHLSMNDIIVMAPDISKFAPAIQAVFGRGPLKSHYCISDRSVRSANLLAETFSRILDLTKSRFEVSRITALLDSPPLRARFGFEDNDVEVLRDWINKSGIRWGRNKADRKGEGDFEEYSWQYGLDRLMLKLAVDGQDEKGDSVLSTNDLLPVNFSTSGENQRLLSGLITFFQELCDFIDDVQEGNRNRKTAEEWCELLKEKRKAFFQADADSALEYSMLGKALGALGKDTQTAGLQNANIPFDTIRTALACTLDNPAKGEPFLNGKITFCSLLPMRGIPCKIIAMLGMDVGEFPRPNDTTGFNLVCRKDDKGNYCGNLLKYYNRSRSIEDRFTFLEAIMSARDYLMIFYKGQDDQTLKELVAAAPVCELRDYIKTIRNSETSDGIFVKHFLNPFAPDNFQKGDDTTAHGQYDGMLRKNFSFDSQMASVAKALKGEKGPSVATKLPFWLQAYTLPLPETLKNTTEKDREITIELSTLEKFLKNPADMYASTRLGLKKSAWDDPLLTDYEPFQIDNINGSALKHKLAAEILNPNIDKFEALPPDDKNPRIKKIFQQAKSEGILPVGEMGRLAFLEAEENTWIADKTFRQEWQKQENSDPRDFEIDLGYVTPGDSAFMREWLTEAIQMSATKEQQQQMQDNLNALKKLSYRVKLHGNFRVFTPVQSPVAPEAPTALSDNDTASENDNAQEDSSPQYTPLPGLRHIICAKAKGHHVIPVFLKHLLLAAQQTDESNGAKNNFKSIFWGKNEHSLASVSDNGMKFDTLPDRVKELLQNFQDENTQSLTTEQTVLLDRIQKFPEEFETGYNELQNQLTNTYNSIQAFKDFLNQQKGVGGVITNLTENLNTLQTAQQSNLFVVEFNALETVGKNFKSSKIKSKTVNDKYEAEYTPPLASINDCIKKFKDFLENQQKAYNGILDDLEKLLPENEDSNSCEEVIFDYTLEDFYCELLELRPMFPDLQTDSNTAKSRLRRIVELYLLNMFYPVPLFKDASPQEAQPKKEGDSSAAQKYKLETHNEQLLFQDCTTAQDILKFQWGERFKILACHCYDGIGKFYEN